MPADHRCPTVGNETLMELPCDEETLEEGLDLYGLAEEDDIDWGQEGNHTLAMLYESEAIQLPGAR